MPTAFPWRTGGTSGTCLYYVDEDYPARLKPSNVSLSEALDMTLNCPVWRLLRTSNGACQNERKVTETVAGAASLYCVSGHDQMRSHGSQPKDNLYNSLFSEWKKITIVVSSYMGATDAINLSVLNLLIK